jgi:hypothetical protein
MRSDVMVMNGGVGKGVIVTHFKMSWHLLEEGTAEILSTCVRFFLIELLNHSYRHCCFILLYMTLFIAVFGVTNFKIGTHKTILSEGKVHAGQGYSGICM